MEKEDAETGPPEGSRHSSGPSFQPPQLQPKLLKNWSVLCFLDTPVGLSKGRYFYRPRKRGEDSSLPGMELESPGNW